MLYLEVHDGTKHIVMVIIGISMDRRTVISLFGISSSTLVSGCLFGSGSRGQPDRISGYVDNFADEVVELTVILKDFEDEILYEKIFVVEPSEGLNSEGAEFEYLDPLFEKYFLEISFDDRDSKYYIWKIACNTRIQVAVYSDTVKFNDSIC